MYCAMQQCCCPPQAALGPGGAVEGLSAGKGYVDMSTVDEATSQEIAAAVAAKGGRFLEVGRHRETADLCL
jgi:3-hydroxyisobutyrate dehydrogenase-like beta-hydroxyacid dehydrogenase